MHNFNNKPIGFFDSGVGGLSVLSRFKKVLPNESTIYYGDTIHLPYGNKTKKELIGYARNIMNFMLKKGVKAVIIACNTSSAQAYDTIKNEYDVPIYPIIQSCSKIIAQNKLKKIGIFATEATVMSGKYTEELKKYNSEIQVKEIASKNWVGIVENSITDIDAAKKHIRYELEEMLLFNPDKIILGCTHYPYLMNEFVKYAPKDIFVDPAEIFVDYLKDDLSSRELLNNGVDSSDRMEQFYVTSSPADFVKNAKIFYDVKNSPILV